MIDPTEGCITGRSPPPACPPPARDGWEEADESVVTAETSGLPGRRPRLLAGSHLPDHSAEPVDAVPFFIAAVELPVQLAELQSEPEPEFRSGRELQPERESKPEPGAERVPKPECKSEPVAGTGAGARPGAGTGPEPE